MKTEIVLKVYCIILSFRKVTTQTQYNSALAVNESQHETRLSKNSETLLNSSFETKKAENEISESAKNCITNLLQLKTKPFTTEECCLNKICLNNYILNKIIREHPHTKELTLKLCTDHFYLSKEKITGCCSGGKSPKRYENNRSLTSVTPNIENPVIANCSIGLKSPKLNNEIKHLKPDIKEDQTQSTDRVDSPSRRAFKLNGLQTNLTSTSQVKDKKIRFENIAKTSARNRGLQFLDVPKGDDMRIHDLRHNEEHLLFEAFSYLMGYLQPAGFPTELIRDVLEKNIPLHVILFQLLKLEIVAVGWILFWAILSFCLPFAIGAQLCCRSNIRRLNEDFSNGSTNFYDKWAGNTLAVLLHILLLLMLCPIILILAGNEQISRSISKSEYRYEIIYEDINTFIRNTHMQIALITTSSTDITFEAIRKDFEDLENLLGKPYQQSLAAETGIDIALDALEELRLSTAKVTNLVSDIVNECALAEKGRIQLQEQLREISRQLTIARQQCNLKDRTLCYTLQYSGYDVTFSCDNITKDNKIRHLHRIGQEDSFNISIDIARESFDKVDEEIALAAASKIPDLKSALKRKRAEVYKSVHVLDELMRSLSETVQNGKEAVSTVVGKLMTWDLWRWLVVLGVATILTIVWGLLLCGAPCGCGVTARTIPLLLSGVALASATGLLVWALGTLTFILGGHGETLLCRPLYDQPHYGTLTDLLDSGGILHTNGGFFSDFKGNGSLKVRHVLRSCQKDEVAYNTFHLHNQMDIDKVINYHSWDDLQSLLANFSLGNTNVEILSPALQLNLQVLSTTSNVNLTLHRAQLSKAITKRDLGSFADQLNTVARQLSDPISSRKIDNLAFMVRKVVQMEMQRLVDIRNRILFKVTALEVLLLPLNKQANQSLSHLKTIQFFLDNQGWQIAEKTSRQFTTRIESYLKDLYNHVSEKLTKQIGKCRPLWEVYHSTRFFVCKLIVDPMNGISFSYFFLILLFVAITPVVIKLVEFYREGNNEDVLTSISHRARDGLLIDDEVTWASPPSATPEIPLGCAAATNREQQATWVSPRRPSQPLIPSPPRMPSNISSQIHSPRMPTLESLSRNLSPQSKLSTMFSRITESRIVQKPSTSGARTPRTRTRMELLETVEPAWSRMEEVPKRWL
ncbi:prominin-1 isoform X2 [Aethina tumida]|uniref:prominin-1 isoform X2 n=1 Tax=Aethina tumida TaxID=116153 RepID=UPI0021472364|nr:prominin-1 isoform X2 [Aethina tumida]